jgi:sorting nexin-8
MRKESFGYDTDPWASPDLHRGHNHTTSTNGGTPPVNGSSGIIAPSRTTSDFTTASNRPQPPPDNSSSRPTNDRQPSWGGYAPSSNDSFRDSGLGGAGAGGSGFGVPSPGGNGPGSNDPADQGRSTLRPVPIGVEETITITSIAEKEGVFMFQHRNYQVASARRNSKVIRRYSDFVWLLDCLHKRYPFRQLPLLPPKRVASMFFLCLFLKIRYSLLIRVIASQWQLLSCRCIIC